MIKSPKLICTLWVALSLGLLLLGAAGCAGTPTASPATPELVVPTSTTAATVPIADSASGFMLGGHIRTWDHIPEMQHAGMTWVKMQVYYKADAAPLIEAAHDSGFKIQLTALGAPDIVTGTNFIQEYSLWVADLADSGADAIEVWNEPNIDREWALGYISPQRYTQLLCAAYAAIKEANPNTQVISAAPAPTGYFGGCSPNGCDDTPFLQGMYAAGAAQCMDYLGAHYAAGATSPSARSGHPADSGRGHHSWYFLTQTEHYYALFQGEHQLVYTELGYASQQGVAPFADMFEWAKGITDIQQAAWLAEAVELGRDSNIVHGIIVWNVDFIRYGYDPQDGYAIIRPDGSCPACETLHGVVE